MRFVMCGAVLATALISGAVFATTAKAAGLSGLHKHIQVGAKVCFADHEHAGNGYRFTNLAQAQVNAVRHWSKFTVLEYGSAWGSYTLASGQRMTCKNHGGEYSCDVIATPCRLGHAAAGQGRMHRSKRAVRRHVVPMSAHPNHGQATQLKWPGDR